MQSGRSWGTVYLHLIKGVPESANHDGPLGLLGSGQGLWGAVDEIPMMNRSMCATSAEAASVAVVLP